jgi:hypothetical protein
MLFVYAIIAAAIAYYFLQSWDDRRARKENREEAGLGKRAGLFFFLLIVILIGLHLVQNAGVKNKSLIGGEVVENIADQPIVLPSNDIFKRIPEEVQVGAPPFRVPYYG